MAEQKSDGGTVLGELLATPLFKELLFISLDELTAEKGRQAVRDWAEDPAVAVALLEAAPKALNYLTGALTEIGAQVEQKTTPRLIQEFGASIKDNVDRQGVRQCAAVWKRVFDKVRVHAPEARRARQRETSRKVARALGQGVTNLSKKLNNMSQVDPGALREFAAELASHVDSKEIEKTTREVSAALKDKRTEMVGSAVRMGFRGIQKMVPNPLGIGKRWRK